MKLLLIRDEYQLERTFGRLFFVNSYSKTSEFLAFTLEDTVTFKKYFGESAIPAGNYTIKLTKSPKFDKILPRLYDVPGFEGILIHSGNDEHDTNGCILVATNRTEDKIYNCKPALDKIINILKTMPCNEIEVI